MMDTSGFPTLDAQGLSPGEVHAWIGPPPSPAKKVEILYNRLTPVSVPYAMGRVAWNRLQERFLKALRKKKRHRSIDDPWEDSSEGS